ncbi:TetR/AcrR family transcriptional regulator [Streptomyces sp. MZ04]|uniref:TetR/AcrR family transcriptional regulator n=1 Tax=Streptomyces sp. MZ04 TaxID=2559236 RepID=UPI001FD82D41|nr:TetR/AcrR family transcriptional regulator [Streptomyces sp. MZ04]
MAAETERTGAEKPGEVKKKRGRPSRIDLDTIVGIARRILQEEGVAALSMRRVAKEVGTTPMALYHHVRDKDELLMLTLSGTADSVPRPELPDDPRDRMLAVSVHMHGTLARMPWVVEVLSLGDLTDKGALWMVEEIVGSAMTLGLTPGQAVAAYRTIWHCVYGDLVFRQAMARRAGEPDRKRHFPDMLDDADAEELPHMTALADRWLELTEDYDVSTQLGAVIDGLLGQAGRP